MEALMSSKGLGFRGGAPRRRNCLKVGELLLVKHRRGGLAVSKLIHFH